MADYTERLTRIFKKHGTWGTWYAHASVGCLHVRPVLNVKAGEDVHKLRAIAEEAFAIVREYGGSHSGEHGDGIVRSEFHEAMFGRRIVRAFEEVKDAFDPQGIMNPGKIVRAPSMDDRSLFRYPPDYAPIVLDTVLDWAPWGGLTGAVEMCNNNGACRKSDPGVMCPSYMVTQDEEHVTRGRANALRLALTGQLGPDALTSEKMYEVMDLCVGCKGCRRECPTGVDMARMKIEFLHHYRSRHGWRMKDRLVADLPRRAPLLRAARLFLQLRNAFPALARFAEPITGFSAQRRLPVPSGHPFRDDNLRRRGGAPPLGEVILLVDTFNRYFEPENARAAVRILTAAGYDVIFPFVRGGRPLCCGRTYLTAGMVDAARREARRTLDALAEPARNGLPIVGLEPSCLLTLRDEFLALVPGEAAKTLASRAMLFEDFLMRERREGRLKLELRALPQKRALVHGHCHQKAFGEVPSVLEALRLIPELEVSPIESSCCGMAGSFGYESEHSAISQAMAERSLLPAVRAAGAETIIVTDGTSCRHQIAEGSGREALHVARILERSLA